jgi:hypothetical protein
MILQDLLSSDFLKTSQNLKRDPDELFTICWLRNAGWQDFALISEAGQFRIFGQKDPCFALA